MKTIHAKNGWDNRVLTWYRFRDVSLWGGNHVLFSYMMQNEAALNVLIFSGYFKVGCLQHHKFPKNILLYYSVLLADLFASHSFLWKPVRRRNEDSNFGCSGWPMTVLSTESSCHRNGCRLNQLQWNASLIHELILRPISMGKVLLPCHCFWMSGAGGWQLGHAVQETEPSLCLMTHTQCQHL